VGASPDPGSEDAPIIAPTCPQMSMDATGSNRTQNNGKASIYAGFRTSLDYLKCGLGGAERDRTADLLVANEALSQLSYSPTPDAPHTAFAGTPQSNYLSECTSKDTAAQTLLTLFFTPNGRVR
jgi:hypothetical protein